MPNTLIVKLNATGDVVRTTTLLHEFAHANVTWITASPNNELLTHPAVRCLEWTERDRAMDRDYDLVVNLEDETDAAAFVEQRSGGVEVVEVPTPAVITTTKGKHEPRYPSLKGIMAAKKKPLEEKDAQVPAARLKIRSLSAPAERAAGKIVGNGADAVPELVRLPKEEAKVL